jgi:hypothetical protein
MAQGEEAWPDALTRRPMTGSVPSAALVDGYADFGCVLVLSSGPTGSRPSAKAAPTRRSARTKDACWLEPSPRRPAPEPGRPKDGMRRCTWPTGIRAAGATLTTSAAVPTGNERLTPRKYPGLPARRRKKLPDGGSREGAARCRRCRGGGSRCAGASACWRGGVWLAVCVDDATSGD